MNLLFVRAQDIKPYANTVADALRLRDQDSITYKQVLRRARLGSPIIRLLEEMVENHTVVVVFASPDLNTDPYIPRLIDYASTQGNLIAVLPPDFKDLHLPPSFFNGLSLLRADKDPHLFADSLLEELKKLHIG